MKTVLKYGALMLALASSGFAVDAAPSRFKGVTVGLQGGYATSDSKTSLAYLFTGATRMNVDMSGRGAIGGGALGLAYVVPSNNMYFGVEAHGTFSNVSGDFYNQEQTVTVVRLGVATNVPAPQTLNVKMKDTFGADLRVGRVMYGSVLPFAKVGYVNSKWTGSATNIVAPANGAGNKRISGFAVGVGADYLVTDRISLGGEYTYASYQDLKFTAPNWANYTVKPTTNTIMARMRVRLF